MVRSGREAASRTTHGFVNGKGEPGRQESRFLDQGLPQFLSRLKGFPMSMKIVLVAAASVMAVTPALAMSKSQITKHSGGPIPYSQLSSMDKSGYNSRSHKGHKAAASDTAVAANSSAAGAANAPDGSADAAANGAAARPTGPDSLAGPAPTSSPSISPDASGAAPSPVNPSPSNPAPSSPAATSGSAPQ